MQSFRSRLLTLYIISVLLVYMMPHYIWASESKSENTTYYIEIASTAEGIAIFANDRLAGMTPCKINVKENEIYELKGLDKYGNTIFHTKIDGRKAPSKILIQMSRNESISAKFAKSAFGFLTGAYLALTIIYIFHPPKW
ncbi:MAG: hypothetical protein ACUVWP_07530 [bacterium]